ncbi:hypothetical protein [Actinomadura atramentaria]|uniref:hypothetical protein n=1 Tax=Actinomadura atramentaria TaxID=1990 RepID=UPI00039A7492|nr:hypothetical protein [Actinomadura atramentaria]
MGARRKRKTGTGRGRGTPGGVGAVLGRAVARELRPSAHRAAPRVRLHASAMIRLMQVLAPLALSVTAARLVRRRRTRRHAAAEPLPLRAAEACADAPAEPAGRPAAVAGS